MKSDIQQFYSDVLVMPLGIVHCFMFKLNLVICWDLLVLSCQKNNINSNPKCHMAVSIFGLFLIVYFLCYMKP